MSVLIKTGNMCAYTSCDTILDILDIVQKLSKMSKVGDLRKAKKMAEFWVSTIWHGFCIKKDRNPS
jgi:hypothetical protein